MDANHHALITIEREWSAAPGSVRLAHLSQAGPTDTIFRSGETYWLDLCLTPRPAAARACYRAQWGAHRFEPLGEVVLVPPEHELHFRGELGADQLSVLCQIERAAVDRWLPGPMEWTDGRLARALAVLQPDIRICLLRLSAELRRPQPTSEELVGHLLAELAVEVARYCGTAADGPVTGGLPSWRLRAIDERLGRQGPPPTLQELADLCSISVRQLTRGFRVSRGSTLGGHIAATRIERAKRLLGSADTIKAVAFELGYASASVFTDAFRRATGMTPSHFRARLRQKFR